MARKKIAINAFGRMGKSLARMIMEEDELELVAINELNSDLRGAATQFKYDSVHGQYPGEVSYRNVSYEIGGINAYGDILVDGQEIAFFRESDPSKLPWKELNVDVVVDCTGIFRYPDQLSKHLEAGARYAVVSAPLKEKSDYSCMVIPRINEEDFDPEEHRIISLASCTTNCLAPVAKILNDEYGIGWGKFCTIHADTAKQPLLDRASEYEKLRDNWSATQSQIMSSTGASGAIGEVIKELEGKLSGYSVRIPTSDVSLLDLTAYLKDGKGHSGEELLGLFEEESKKEFNGIIRVNHEPLDSAHFKGDRHTAIVDSFKTDMIFPDVAQVTAWYDNEVGYSSSVIRFIRELVPAKD